MEYPYSDGNFRLMPDPINMINANLPPLTQNYSYSSHASNISMYLPQSPGLSRPVSIQQSDPRYKINNTTPLLDGLDHKSDDELLIENFLSKTGKINLSLQPNVEIITQLSKPLRSLYKTTLKIHVAKSLLHRCIKLLVELENIENYLRRNVSTISSTEWKEKTERIGQQRDEFTALLSQFDNSDALDGLRRGLKNRKKKRISQRRKKIARREEQADEHKTRQLIHKIIDRWLENMEDNVERTRREESLKKDADCVLSEVTKKKSDARKNLSILAALVKLRSVREQAAFQRGEKISLEDSNAFTHNTEKLQKMWENALNVYGVEEHGLRIMLEKNAAEEIESPTFEDRKIVSEWERALFGSKGVPNETYWGLICAEKDLGTFMALRKSWDTFLIPAEHESGSKIPIGWVFPASTKSTSTNWSTFLQKDS